MMARMARTSRKCGSARVGHEAYEPDPEPTTTSSEDEDEGEEANDDDGDPQELDPEELEADTAINASIPEVQARNAVEDYYHYTLGFTRAAACSLYMDQGLWESRHLTGLTDRVSVEKLCKYVRAEAKTTIVLQACQHLNMLVYYLRHQKRT
jgi:hypothetical protein